MPKPIYRKVEEIELVEEMIRVNHAGEYGAFRIYVGQLDSCDKKYKEMIREMLDQEIEHLEFFKSYALRNNVRPTLFIGFWGKIGYLFGYISAKIDLKYAMISTEAIESVIEKHYQEQIDELSKSPHHNILREAIKKFQQDEIHHKEIGNKYFDQYNPVNVVFSDAVKSFCRFAICISKKL